MLARQAILCEVFLIATIALFSWAESDYQLKDSLSKETWEKIQQLGDVSGDVSSVLQQYKGDRADYCRDQLTQQDYRAGLDKKLTFYRGKIEYDDKLLQSDLLKCGSSEPCKKEVKTKYEQNMDACISNANVYIPGLKNAAVKNLKDYMESCTSGKPIPKEQTSKTTKKSEVEPQKEEGDQYHW